jgi:hypothetical protein
VIKNQEFFIFRKKSVDFQSSRVYYACSDYKSPTNQRGGVLMIDTIKLEMSITKARITKRELAKQLGISEMSLYNKIHNISEFKASEIRQLSEILELSDGDRQAIFFA